MTEGITSNDTESVWNQIVREMKEKICFVTPDLKQALDDSSINNSNEIEYTLPGGEVIKINEGRFLAPETLFKPSLIK